MKKQLFLVLFTFSFVYCFSQKYDTKNLEGTWVATLGSKSYEVTFVRESVYEKNSKEYLEVNLGSIKYLENGKIVKAVDKNGFESPLGALYRGTQKFTIHYIERDNGKKICGRAYFDINADGKTARWYNLYEVNAWDSEPKKDKLDIPKELTFKKK